MVSVLLSARPWDWQAALPCLGGGLALGWLWAAGWKRRARAAREDRDRLEEALPLAVVRANAQGRIRSWNPAAEELFGYASKEMLGSTLSLLAGGGDDALQAGRRQAREQGRWSGELALVRRDGERVDCQALLLCQRAGGGLILEELALFSDVTRLRRSEAARVRLEDELRQSQKMETVGQLAGGLAHDFNNLLTSILGYARILGHSFEPDSEEGRDLAELEDAGRRAADLTRRLLSFSRQCPTRVAPVELVELVHGTLPLLRPSLGAAVHLEVEEEVAAAWVLADRTELEQVIVNLVLNARDAMPGGGRLTVLVGESRGEGGDSVRLAVRDEGMGMTSETLQRIFDPFFTTKAAGKGTGLGLCTVEAIIERYGGSIEVASELGRGTTFDILLPRVEPRLEEARQEGEWIAPVGAATVLVAEDEPLVSRMICYGLREAGYAVLEARTAAEARQLFESHAGSVALLVTDVIMPGEGGVELAASLRERDPALGVLYISGYHEDAVLPHGVPIDDAAFLEKPFTATQLQAAIASLLADRAGSQAALPRA